MALARRSLGDGGMANLRSAPRGVARQRIDAKKRISIRAIIERFTDKPVKIDDTEERRVSTELKMIYEGGSLDGKTANLPTRDLVVGLHRGNCHFFETYKRTIWINVRTRRTIFRWTGLTVKSIKIQRQLVEEAARDSWHPQTEGYRNIIFSAEG